MNMVGNYLIKWVFSVNEYVKGFFSLYTNFILLFSYNN